MGSLVVIAASRQRLARESFPLLRAETRHQHIVLAGELPANGGNLAGLLAGGEHHLGKSEPPWPVKVEREIAFGHRAILIAKVRGRIIFRRCDVSFPFSPGLTEPKIVDLTDSSDDLLLNATREELTQALRAGDGESLAQIEGTWAAFAREGVTIRLARTLGRPLRYFVAKRTTGPYLVVADRIDAIADYCREEGIAWQFHPSYTRVVPAHHITELDQVGCPDPNPRYQRFFTPAASGGSADIAELGVNYVEALRKEIARVLAVLPQDAPLGVALSGGADSTAIAALLWKALGMTDSRSRLTFFTFSAGGGTDRQSAQEVVRGLGAESQWEVIESAPSEIDPAAAVVSLEDYRPLDVACGAVMRAFLKGLRAAHPALVYLFDGDGGDENWKSYPVEDSDLTIRSVLNNPLLYHEGWGVDSLKHSLTYTGGFSRGVVRGFAPAREFGFRVISPHAMRPAIEAALAAPLRDLVGDDLGRLYALKGLVISAGLRAEGFTLALAPKKRLQEGATSSEVFAARLNLSRGELRKIHEDRFASFGPGSASGKVESGRSRVHHEIGLPV